MSLTSQADAELKPCLGSIVDLVNEGEGGGGDGREPGAYPRPLFGST